MATQSRTFNLTVTHMHLLIQQLLSGMRFKMHPCILTAQSYKRRMRCIQSKAQFKCVYSNVRLCIEAADHRLCPHAHAGLRPAARTAAGPGGAPWMCRGSFNILCNTVHFLEDVCKQYFLHACLDLHGAGATAFWTQEYTVQPYVRGDCILDPGVYAITVR